MPTTEQRKLMAQVEKLGYTYKDDGGNNEVIMHHPVGGVLRIHATPSDTRYEKNKLTEARRRIRAGTTRYGAFVTYLMDLYEVPRDGQREMRIDMRKEAREYIDRHKDGGRLESLVQQVDRDPRLEVLERRQGQKMWHIRLTGPEYGAPSEDEPRMEEEPMLRPANNNAPMESIIESLREMMLSELSGELDDLRAKHDLTVETLTGLVEALNAPAKEAVR